ncbi:MAG TPA: hypothetical protein ENK00_06100 [Chromatiales bacterium]|nr:hypothetical protein [Chromatiales bacterium]
MGDELPIGLPADLPAWARWLAQDGDGSWWVYEVEPLRYHAGWYENELGRRWRVGQGPPRADWGERLWRLRSDDAG